jgi:nitrogenase-stabilizing/protective protein
MSELLDTLKGLSTAEEFLEYFGIPFEQQVVNVNRLHILKRFHDYVRQRPSLGALGYDSQRAAYRECLLKAYEDFVHSDALTEKVFKVFQNAAGVRTIPVRKVRASLAGR